MVVDTLVCETLLPPEEFLVAVPADGGGGDGFVRLEHLLDGVVESSVQTALPVKRVLFTLSTCTIQTCSTYIENLHNIIL